MGTITQERLTNEEIFCNYIEDFFDCRKLPEHFIFIEYWMEKMLTNKQHKKKLNASDLLFFSTKISNLLNISHRIYQNPSETLLYFEESIKIPESLIIHEQKSLVFYPTHLRKKEICNPMLVLSSIFKNHTLSFYENDLQNWVNNSSSISNELNHAKQIFPIYTNLKRMIEACWLIHERLISKNSYQTLPIHRVIQDFSHSCPLLLKDEYYTNPYLMIENFFSFASLTEYKEDLTQWFKASLNEQRSFTNANDLLFIHNQFIQLIHAGYIIGTSKLKYEPRSNYTKSHNTFGHWLLARMDNQYSIQLLSPHFKENPLEYCSEILTLNHVSKMRFGLKEWLEAALSENMSIAQLDSIYIFDQFEDLQKTLEALFLLIIQPALAD